MSKPMMKRDVMPLRITSSRRPDVDVDVESYAGELVAGFQYSRLFAHQLPSGLYVSPRAHAALHAEDLRPTGKMASQDLHALLEEQGRAGEKHRAHTVDRDELTTTKRVVFSRDGATTRPRRRRRMFVAFDPSTLDDATTSFAAPHEPDTDVHHRTTKLAIVAPLVEDLALPRLASGSIAPLRGEALVALPSTPRLGTEAELADTAAPDEPMDDECD
jgi:hypothetical protein